MEGRTMGQILHGSATTTEVARCAIQRSSDSPRALAKRYGIIQKTVAKWKKRTGVADLPTGPRTPRSTVLGVEDEAVIARVSPPPSAAAGRLLVRAAAEPPASEPLGPASLLAAARHLAPARSWRRQARQEALQTVSHRVFSP
jgi:transposase-like protein